jgi:hypothetical protein
MWTIEKFKEIYSRYETSGLCARDFCYNERITRSRFYYWLKQYRKKCVSKVSVANPPVSAARVNSKECASGFIPLFVTAGKKGEPYRLEEVREKPSSSASTPDTFMEVCYPNGTRVRLLGEKDMGVIKALIELSR